MTKSGRWFTLIPLEYVEGEAFWVRDAGLLALGFRRLGNDARFVCLGPPTERADLPLITCRLEQMSDPAWWRQWQLAGVVAYTWSLDRYEPVVRAVREAGARVVLKLDTDGVGSVQIWPHRYFHTSLHAMIDQGRSFAWLRAGLKTLVNCLFVRSRSTGLLRHYAHADLLTIESPMARERFARFLRLIGGPQFTERLVVVPHPVAPEMRADSVVERERVIIAVGGWHRHVKGAPMLLDVLRATLALRPDYRAEIIGPGDDTLRALAADWPPELHARVTFTGPLPHEEIQRRYTRSRIALNTSHSEGFSIALAESLCCGCSIVGYSGFASVLWCSGEASGTPACTRSTAHLSDALLAEIAAWEEGQRDPAQISRVWSSRVHADRVASRIMELACQPR